MTRKGEMPFLDHLEELRWRILRCLVALAVCSGLGIFAAIKFRLVDVLLAPLTGVVADLAAADPRFLGILDGGRLTFLNLPDPFFFIIKLGIIAGIVFASPVLIYQVWAFLAPAMKEEERRAIIPTLVLGVLLFAGGVMLSYLVVLPVTISFLLQFGAEWFTPALTASYYLTFVSHLLLGFGFAFELPVVLMVLTTLGLVSSKFLRTKRRHAVVAIAVLSSFLSPGDGLISTLLMAGPLVVLFELGIVLSMIVERKRRARGDVPAAPEDSVPLASLITVLSLWPRESKARG